MSLSFSFDTPAGKVTAGGSAADGGTMASSDAIAKGPGQPSTPEDIPGEDKHLASRLRGAAEGALQGFAPIRGIHQHVCGFHVYAHDFTRQVEAHHYCSHINEEMRQCIIYDSDKSNARLIGIEYIISRRLFEGLPADEKKFWHSHEHEVMSGMLVAPRVPEPAERLEMASLVDTYGKTIHTWQYDRGDTLPLGPPQLMMALTEDGMLDPALVKKRDADYGISTEAKKKARQSSITPPTSLPEGCDPWKNGRKAPQLQAEEVDVKMPSNFA
jgi:hypothetical protein